MSDSRVFLPVAEAYDRWSGRYDHYDNPMVFGASQIVNGLAKDIAGKSVVEFGCGTGRNLHLLKQHGAASVAGSDLSSGMLAQARLRDPALLLFQQDMTQALPLPDGAADLVLFSLTLEHVATLAAPLREAKRLLRPSGTIEVIEIHPYLSMSQVAAHFRDEDRVVEMPTYPHRFSDYVNAAADTGLRVARCKEWTPRDFAGPLPDKVLKRGPDSPLIIAFTLCLDR